MLRVVLMDETPWCLFIAVASQG